MSEPRTELTQAQRRELAARCYQAAADFDRYARRLREEGETVEPAELEAIALDYRVVAGELEASV